MASIYVETCRLNKTNLTKDEDLKQAYVQALQFFSQSSYGMKQNSPKIRAKHNTNTQSISSHLTRFIILLYHSYIQQTEPNETKRREYNIIPQLDRPRSA